MAKAVEQEIEFAPEPAPKKSWLGKFIKGALITAAVVMGVMAIVAGTMGAGAIGGLAVSGIPVLTFEEGVAAGLSKGFEFLTGSVLGWATMAVGGIGGAYLSARKEQQQAHAPAEAERRAKLMELTQGVEQQQKIETAPEKPVEKAAAPVPQEQPQSVAKAQPQPVEQHHHHHTERNTREVEKTHTSDTQIYAAERTIEVQGKDKQDGIYLANSTIKGQGFSASELKRRVEREISGDMKTV